LGVSAEETKAVLEAKTEKQIQSNELKRKVMSLGNRLASGMDRSAAFIQAWAIVKAGGLELAVKGVSFGSRQAALRRLAAYTHLCFYIVFHLYFKRYTIDLHEIQLIYFLMSIE
jgi:hypothetical protein